MAVQLNDTIEIPTEWPQKVTIHWSQDWKSRDTVYYKVGFTNTNSSREQGKALFIQQEMADQLKDLGTVRGSKLSLEVTSDFLNGQDTSGQNRWLVFHDKSRDIYQHRFVKAVLQIYAERLDDIAKENLPKAMGDGVIRGISDGLSGFVGDALNPME